MPYRLIIGDYAYSSWSLRGWLLFDRFDIPGTIRIVDFNGPGVAEQLGDAFPARTVPALLTGDGAVLWDSLALAEELASREPQAGLWPSDPTLRGLARSLAAEMHSGFGALRSECPMNLRVAYADFAPSDDTRADLARIDALWNHALTHSGGPWLCGDYSIADAFYAPVAARIAGYGINMSDQAAAYVARHLSDPAFRRWRAMGLIHGDDLPWYALDYATKPWPGPKPLTARKIDTGTPENAQCPYSGKPVTHLLAMDGRTFGFCNAFCRDKTAEDPEAWPAFMALT